MKLFLLSVLAFSVSACCSTPTSPDPIALKQWSRDEQRQILTEEEKLPADSILISVIEDYVRLRREASQ